MGQIDAAIFEDLATATAFSVQELNASAGTEQEHICWVKVNFIKHFTEDMFFLNDHSEDETFLRRYGNLIIRNMLEQLIEFLYLKKNPQYAEDYLGLSINFDEVNRKTSIINKESLFGNKRYHKASDGRPSVSEMAQDIGEKGSANDNLTLYKLYQILSEQCHNSYFSSLVDDVNKVHSSISTSRLNENQLKDMEIMSLIVLEEFAHK